MPRVPRAAKISKKKKILQDHELGKSIIIINTLSSYLATEPLLVYHKVNHALSGWTKPLCVGPCTHEAIAYIFKSIYMILFYFYF